nr:hypothetical protein HK105_003637 [Polyrhizophydium stewartii]
MTRQALSFVPQTVVDAFTTKPFAGNPAAVIVLDAFFDDAMLLKIAAEFNLSETAFAVPVSADSTHEFKLRWFTPAVEVPLCGHATLATSHVLFSRMTPEQRGAGPLRFQTLSGELVVKHLSSNEPALTSRLEMAFPDSHVAPNPKISREVVARAIGIAPEHIIYHATGDWGMLVEIDVVAAGTTMAKINPSQRLLEEIDVRATVITTIGDKAANGGFDFESRMFAPLVGVPEDPVCGSAHCVAARYWSQKLGRNEFRALQPSPRGGDLGVVHDVDNGIVRLSGDAVTVSQGTLFL